MTNLQKQTLGTRSILALIKLYQTVLSPFTGRHCRFHPTCSAYTAEAVRKYGALRGGWMGIKRICRCHPYNDGGCDPVP